MGKRKYAKMEKILNKNSRNVTYLKRTKGLIKKSIELSLLCDQKMFLFIYDENKKRVMHFASDEDFDFLEIFNKKLEREFLTNDDYQRVGGQDVEDGDETENENENGEQANPKSTLNS